RPHRATALRLATLRRCLALNRAGVTRDLSRHVDAQCWTRESATARLAISRRTFKRWQTDIHFVYFGASFLCGRMDASPAEFGIHGRNRPKSAAPSAYCHGCSESAQSGIHGGIHALRRLAAQIPARTPASATQAVSANRAWSADIPPPSGGCASR